jgi:general secretion pathway protein M
MRNWLATLNPRERALVIAAGVLVILTLVYVLAIAPFYRAIDQRSERVARKQGDLAWMQSVAGELEQLAASGAAPAEPSADSLVVLVDRTSREAGLGGKVTGQTPTGDAGIRVRLEQAPFDALVTWMAALEQRHGILIDSASVDRAGQSGLVNASVVLARPGG